jgi:hypothetical protein
MVRNGGLANGKAVGDFSGSHFPLAEPFQNATPNRVVQGFKQSIHII